MYQKGLRNILLNLSVLTSLTQRFSMMEFLVQVESTQYHCTFSMGCCEAVNITYQIQHKIGHLVCKNLFGDNTRLGKHSHQLFSHSFHVPRLHMDSIRVGTFARYVQLSSSLPCALPVVSPWSILNTVL